MFNTLLITFGLEVVLTYCAQIAFSADFRTINPPYAGNSWQHRPGDPAGGAHGSVRGRDRAHARHVAVPPAFAPGSGDPRDGAEPGGGPPLRRRAAPPLCDDLRPGHRRWRPRPAASTAPSRRSTPTSAPRSPPSRSRSRSSAASTTRSASIVGGLFLGVVESLTTLYIGPTFADVASFGILLLVLIVRPSGLLGPHRVRPADITRFDPLFIVVALALLAAAALVRLRFADPVRHQHACCSRCWRKAGTSSAATPATPRSATPSSTAWAATASPSPWCSGTCLLRSASGWALSSAIVFACSLGVAVLRLKGHYFAIATLALAQVMAAIVSNVKLAGQNVGLVLPPLNNDRLFYELALGLLVLATLTIFWLTRSRFGFGLIAIRENEEGAAVMGVNTDALQGDGLHARRHLQRPGRRHPRLLDHLPRPRRAPSTSA